MMPQQWLTFFLVEFCRMFWQQIGNSILQSFAIDLQLYPLSRVLNQLHPQVANSFHDRTYRCRFILWKRPNRVLCLWWPPLSLNSWPILIFLLPMAQKCLSRPPILFLTAKDLRSSDVERMYDAIGDWQPTYAGEEADWRICRKWGGEE